MCTGHVTKKNPDRYTIFKLFEFYWFQSKGFKQVKAHRNNYRNNVTGGKRGVISPLNERGLLERLFQMKNRGDNKVRVPRLRPC